METSKNGLYIIRPLVKEEITTPADSFPGAEAQVEGESS
jgi:hypothetical protein